LDFSREQNIPIHYKGRKIDTRCGEIARLINTVRDQTPEEARPQECATRPAERGFASFATPSRRSWSESVPHGEEPRGRRDTRVMEPFASFSPIRGFAFHTSPPSAPKKRRHAALLGLREVFRPEDSLGG
jgi:hypothetical protein